MRSYFIHSEQWQNRNDRLQSILQTRYGLKSDVGIRIFPQLELALYELTQGTCFFYAHKRSLSLQMGSSPLISHFQKLFLREGYQVQVLSTEQFLQAQTNWDQWAQEIKKDTCLCLLQADHPVLDQSYELESFLAKCDEKKIYSVVLHHQSFLQKLRSSPEFLTKVNPYSVHVLSWANETENDLAVALCGDRFKTPSLIADQIESSSFVKQVEDVLQSLQKESAQATPKDKIIAAAQKREADFPHAYQQATNRQYRQMMIGTKNSSDLVFQRLLEKQPANETFLFCPSMCMHQLMTPQFQWWKDAPDLSLLKHLLIVDAHLATDEKFWEELRQIDATLAPSEFTVQV